MKTQVTLIKGPRLQKAYMKEICHAIYKNVFFTQHNLSSLEMFTVTFPLSLAHQLNYFSYVKNADNIHIKVTFRRVRVTIVAIERQ